MVRKLGPPSRPLPKAKQVWRWNPPQPSARWWWCRVYHQGKYTPDGITFRRYGPTARFDHHQPADPPVVDTTGRRVLYVGEDLATSACEVFGDAGIAAICPNYRVAIIAPTTTVATVSHEPPTSMRLEHALTPINRSGQLQFAAAR
jgi:RES domain